MTRRRAGEPEAQPGPAGAAAERREPPKAPAIDGDSTAASAPGAEPEREQVEHDLDELLAETRRERDEYLELAQRTKADFENYRRRVSRDAEEAGQRAVASLAADLIPSLDNLERALRAAGVDPESADQPADESESGSLARGVLLTYRDMRSTLERAGLESYDPSGEAFDPEWHEALQTSEAEGVAPGKVLEVLDRGYRLDGRVVRPARVIVSG
jgi:molecular chaperone GrpE